MNTIGIGKLVLDNTDSTWNYPHFHVLVFQESEEDVYYSYCMELGIDAFSADSATDSFYKIVKNVLEISMKYDSVNSLFESLLDIAGSDYNDAFWKEYRIAETRLARVANDLGSGLIGDLKNEIERLRKELNKTSTQRISNMGFHSLEDRQVA